MNGSEVTHVVFDDDTAANVVLRGAVSAHDRNTVVVFGLAVCSNGGLVIGERHRQTAYTCDHRHAPVNCQTSAVYGGAAADAPELWVDRALGAGAGVGRRAIAAMLEPGRSYDLTGPDWLDRLSRNPYHPGRYRGFFADEALQAALEIRQAPYEACRPIWERGKAYPDDEF